MVNDHGAHGTDLAPLVNKVRDLVTACGQLATDRGSLANKLGKLCPDRGLLVNDLGHVVNDLPVLGSDPGSREPRCASLVNDLGSCVHQNAGGVTDFEGGVHGVRAHFAPQGPFVTPPATTSLRA